MDRIPVYEPSLGREETEAVAAALAAREISGSGGEALDGFERDFAAYCGRTHGVAVANGSVALDLAFAALDLPPGAEVVMPTFTIISCLTAVLRAGAVPVLVDSDPRTGCLDVAAVESRITERTRAILAVHIYGHPVEMDPLLALAERRGLALVEDAAEAHGAEYELGHGSDAGVWRRCGSFGVVSTFSFYANKPLTTGEGGMVLTDDAALASRLRSRRNLGFGQGRRFLHEELGWNFRLSNVLAAIGCAQLARLDDVVRAKRSLAARYAERLGGLDDLELPGEASWARSIYWMYAVKLREEAPLDAAELAARLDRAGIDTRPFFLGMHEQPAALRLGLFAGESYPVAERLARRGLYLPSSVGLTDGELDRISTALTEALR